MSIPVLIQTYDELRRLAIAGSALSPGDFRLKKLVPALQKSGEKAPVFAKVAQAAEAVVESDEKTASTPLLELATLVNAILYTQGETGAAGDFLPLETVDLGMRTTQAGARAIKPLLEALSSTGSGRVEVVRDAFERGTFKDLRLVKPALTAIDDPYPEIGDFVCEHVLPLYGRAIQSELTAKLDIKGRGGDVNRLRLLHKLDFHGTRALVQRVLSEGSKEMKVAAIECLGDTDDDLSYLLEQSRSKAKDVRAAALRALTATEAKSADVLTTLKKAIAGPDLELIVARVKESKLPTIQDFVLEQSAARFAELLTTKDKAIQGEAVAKLLLLIACLEDRTDANATAFLLQCFEKYDMLAAIKSEPAGSDLNECVAQVLSCGTREMQKRLASAHANLPDGMLRPAIFAARAVKTPADFYKEFAPSLRSLAEKSRKKADPKQLRAAALESVLLSDGEHASYARRIGRTYFAVPRRETPLKELDPRWLDAAIEAGSVDLVCALARPAHKATNAFLSKALAEIKQPHDAFKVLRTIVTVGHPDATECLMATLKKHADTSSYYVAHWFAPLIPELPKSALPALEALLTTLPEKTVDQLLESVILLKNKSE